VNDRLQQGRYRINEAFPGFNGFAEVKIRGQHSIGFPQQSYSVNLLVSPARIRLFRS
jgi:hypothetical protein